MLATTFEILVDLHSILSDPELAAIGDQEDGRINSIVPTFSQITWSAIAI